MPVYVYLCLYRYVYVFKFTHGNAYVYIFSSIITISPLINLPIAEFHEIFRFTLLKQQIFRKNDFTDIFREKKSQFQTFLLSYIISTLLFLKGNLYCELIVVTSTSFKFLVAYEMVTG